MSNRDEDDQATVKLQTMVRSEKKIIPHEEGNDPELEPLFANHFELFRIGTDIYLDIGIMRPGDILDLKKKVESAPADLHTVTFNVLQRIAMSPDGFERLRAGVDLIIESTKGENVAE
ncbi:MAG TPA: hypothetical protein VGZ73_21230 [Bryobacteraceae bacterium]|jgi:hypothetical protein|nr:hypothetical protein [Bryobacteraceae bacterium]